MFARARGESTQPRSVRPPSAGRGLLLPIALACALLLALPGFALASSVGMNGSTLTFTAAASEDNGVEISLLADGSNYTITDSKEITSSSPCQTDPEATTRATCPAAGVTQIVVALGDLDDSLNVTAPTNTLVAGGSGADGITTGRGSDGIDGGVGGDLINTGTGSNTVEGGAGADEIFGSDGNDTLRGGIDDDRIGGGGGVDAIYGDEGKDILSGGDGNDTIFARDGEADSITCDSGTDKATADALDAVDCETVDRGGGTADKTPPTMQLIAASRQRLVRLRAVLLTATLNEAGTIEATGTLRIGLKTFKLTPLALAVAAGDVARLKVRIPPVAFAALKRAVAAGKKATATIKVTGRDEARNLRTATRTVTAKR